MWCIHTYTHGLKIDCTIDSDFFNLGVRLYGIFGEIRIFDMVKANFVNEIGIALFYLLFILYFLANKYYTLKILN